ncbi:hypothetical protein D918_05727 [Trichuris suis]|nr:hypothetical protein D918_05727 [Trichuris suis]
MKAIRFAYSDEALLPSLPEAARLVQESRVRSFGCSKEERDDAYNLNLKRSNGSLNGFPLAHIFFSNSVCKLFTNDFASFGHQ